MDPPSEFRRGDRTAEQVSLREAAAEQLHTVSLRLRFDGFGKRNHPQSVREVGDRPDHRGGVIVVDRVGDERAVDLQQLDREMAQSAQR